MFELMRGDVRVLMMSPSASNPALTEKGHPTILRLFGRDDAQGGFIAPWIAENYKGKKIAILHDRSAYGKGLATIVKDKLEAAGVNEVHVRRHQPSEKERRRGDETEERRRPDFVSFGGYHTEAGLILRQAAEQGYRPRLIGRRHPRHLRVLAGNRGAGGRRRALHLHGRSASLAERSQGARTFKAQGVDPGGYALFNYAVVQAIADGVRRAGSDDPKAVAKALENGEPVETVLGPVRLTARATSAARGTISTSGRTASTPRCSLPSEEGEIDMTRAAQAP